MPSVEHAAFVELVRTYPDVVPTLLQQALGVALPPFDSLTVQEAVLDQLAPTELRADLVIELGHDDTPRLAVVLEVQRRVDPDKAFSWPAYLTNYRARRRCDAMVLVLTQSADVAAWARRAVRLGPGNDGFRVHVLGPAEMPSITDPAVATAEPALTLLSVLTHGNERGGRPVLEALLPAFLSAVDNLDKSIYLHLIHEALSEPLRRALKDYLMLREQYPGLKFFPELQRLIDIGKAEGEAIGEAKGEAKGEARGEARGKVEGERRLLFLILAQRGIVLAAEQRATLDSCDDTAQLELWAKRALTATSAADLFD